MIKFYHYKRIKKISQLHSLKIILLTCHDTTMCSSLKSGGKKSEFYKSDNKKTFKVLHEFLIVKFSHLSPSNNLNTVKNPI